MTNHRARLCATALALLCALSLSGQVSVLTYHNDLARTGQNLSETILSPSNVRDGKFGQLFRAPVDGQIYGQPLYLWGVAVPGKGIHNIVFVATEHDSVYAFDADNDVGPNAAPLWHASFINPAAGVTTVPADNLACKVITPEIGITATPVIDPLSGTLYVVAMTLEDFGSTYVQRLHALDVSTGAERPGSPVRIEASAPGTGDGNTIVTFKPWLYKARAGLLLLNGVVYTAWSSHCDSGNYHGWVIGYDAKTLRRAAVYTSTPNWDSGSIWQSGAAPAADQNGNIYVVTGNGTFDAERGGADLSDSVVKLATGTGLAVADYFAPSNADVLNVKDLDLGSSGALLLPDSAGTPEHPHLLVTGSKAGGIYVLDREQMGHFQPGGDNQIVQSLPSAVGPLFGIPAYFNNTLYFAARNDAVKAFPIQNGRLAEQPGTQSTGPFAVLGSVPAISANGTADGIVWTIDPAGLHAYDAANLTSELYRGNIGNYVKFSTPAIANGKVYAATGDSLVVLGLLTAPAIDAVVNAGGYQAGGVAPGSIISIFGTNLAATSASGDPQVLVNGIAAPLLYASPPQINAQIPWEIPLGSATVIVTLGDTASTPIRIIIQQAAPGIFAVLNPDGHINGPGHPVAAGSTVQALATGLGPANATLDVTAAMGNQNATVLSSALAPGSMGLFEISLRVPELAAGKTSLVIQAGGVPSNSVLVNVNK